MSQSSRYPGAASRACSADEAALPTVGALLGSTPQLTSYLNALKTAGLNSIPGTQVTSECDEGCADAGAATAGTQFRGLRRPQAGSAAVCQVAGT